MAQHIQSVRTSGVPLASRAELYAALRPGDLVFCWSRTPVGQGIESFTGGPSHVLKAWLPFATGPWLTLEAEFEYGVRFGQLADYLGGGYAGDLVLARRPLSLSQVEAELTFGASLLDYKYNTVEFVSLVARRFFSKFPIIQPAHELYCSGLQQAVAAVAVPFNLPSVPWATPEQLYIDPSVTAVCALLEGAK